MAIFLAEAFNQRITDFFALFALLSLILWGIVLCSMFLRALLRWRYREAPKTTQDK